MDIEPLLNKDGTPIYPHVKVNAEDGAPSEEKVTQWDPYFDIEMESQNEQN